MPGTFSQIYIQIIFAVKNRDGLIRTTWEEELYKYITGIVREKQQKMLAINGTSDHIHFLIGMRPSCCLSNLVQEVKKSTNNFISEKKFCPFHFEWQQGYGAFSYSHSALDKMIGYIQNQKEHHRKRTFREEYVEFLEKFGVDFKEDYLFKWL